MFGNIFIITLPIFIIILIGFFAVRLSVFPKDGARALGIFVVNFGIPAILFKALSERSFEDLSHPDFVTVYAIGALIPFFAVFVIARFIKRNALSRSSMMAMGSCFPNTLMIGYPVLLQVFGSAALIPLTLALLVENFLLLPLTVALADSGKGTKGGVLESVRKILFQVLSNPFILAIALGALFSLLEIRLPQSINKVIDMFAATVGAVALFAIGAVLAGIKIRGFLSDVSIVVVAKLMLHPLCIFALLLLFPDMEPLLLASVLILSSLPMLSIYGVIGQKYGEAELCSAAILPATLISFISINLILYYLHQSGHIPL